MYPSYETIAAQSGHYPFVEVYQFLSADVYQFTGADDTVAEDTRPTPETMFYEPPYFNTWDHGRICIGSAHVPKGIDVASVASWEEAFFSSAFTHPNHGSQRVTYPNGVYAFWRDMLDGRFQAYPREVLISMNRTLGQLLISAKGD